MKIKKMFHSISSLMILIFLFSNIVLGVSIYEDSTFTSTLAQVPPQINGIIEIGEWDNASKIELYNGFLCIQNDQTNIYFLFDVTEDYSNQTIDSEGSWQDYFWLSFDVDLDGKITKNKDVLYSKIPSTPSTLGLAYHLSPGGTTGLYSTVSKLGIGFGSSINSKSSHRFWELAIRLEEIKANPTGKVRIGFRIHSQIPEFTEEIPRNYSYDFSDLIELKLGIPYEPELIPENTDLSFDWSDFQNLIIYATTFVLLVVIILYIVYKLRSKPVWSNKERNLR